MFDLTLVGGFIRLVSVAEAAFVIPAEAGIQFLGFRPLLDAFAGASLLLRKQGQG